VGGDGRKTRGATDADWPTIAAVLARAFYDDPFMTFALPDAATRLARAEGMFLAQLEGVFTHTSEVYTTPDLEGAAVWTPPDAPSLPAAGDRAVGTRMGELFGDRLPVIGAALAEVYRHRPEGDSWYLDFLGTDPDRQGRGVATAVLGPVLDRGDAKGTPAILWTTTEANVAFYSKRGFEVTAPIEPGHGAPRVWWMRREPQPAR
jgi:GNAT superfamily N-acetyltransferase